jgi:uncharacterized protein
MTPQEKLAKEIQLLEILSKLDAQLKVHESEVESGEQKLASMKEQSVSLEARLASDRTSVEEMKRIIGDLKLEARQMTNQLEKSREKMARSRNERETMAAQRESEELRKLIRDREEEIGKLTTLLDAAKRSISECEDALLKVEGELSSSESDILKRLGEAKKACASHQGERDAITKQINRMYLRRYEVVRAKRGTGVAHLVKGICQACHMTIPPQLAQRLMLREILEQCPSCMRLIYWVGDQSDTNDEESAG